MLVMLVLIIVLGIFYLIQVNDIVVKGYSIEKYKNRISQIKSENKNLEFQLADYKSLSYIEKNVPALNLKKIDKISFVPYNESAIAQGY